MSWIHSVLFLFLTFPWCVVTGESSPEVTDDGAPMEKTEREALYSAIQGFVGDSWNGSDLYPDPCGWTPIQGVSCDLYGDLWYVTDLTLGLVHENSLPCDTSLKIKPQLFKLKHLKSLTFFNCFTSPITIAKEDWINFGSSLESLEFRANPGLNGELPETIGSLTKLKSLVVLENGFNGNLPASLCNLTRLQRLVLAGNLFNGTIPDCFNGFKDLLILDLSRNLFSGTLPLSIGEMVSLLKLDLSNNQLEGKLPQEIGFLKNLTLLDLRNNRISGGLFENVVKIRSLSDLVLSGNPMGSDDDDMMGIKWEDMGSLVILDLSKMGLRGEIPSGLASLKRLRFLGLNDNNLTGTVPSKELETLPCLGALYINGNNLTGELGFSRNFYEKMGTRFKASKNPNLCQRVVSESHQRCVGLKPCMMEKREGGLVIKQTWSNLKEKEDESSSSTGVMVTRHVLSNGFIWDLLLLVLSLVLVLYYYY
ncbi:PREDICTED: piriformospora indica-insensitive protein 2-like [Camelina sativa]|uniref:Piriformospora indica-insensitive protein 2-like n=1 Tax=Camelina sativa TaxID=90675 RepID=A0ABM0TEK3_CAMSA|nr:PREDICTED: piriformospora indica-insensitive protein 2-like [Camelina sativa]